MVIRMTEKRFVPIGVEWTDGFIQDHISDRDLFNIGAVCNLLNDLSEENEQLKKEIENLKITIQARDVLIEVCEKKFRELGFIITVDDDGYVIE